MKIWLSQIEEKFVHDIGQLDINAANWELSKSTTDREIELER